ncbi:eukaryotic translation initiation factor 5a [Fusarium austroafricanum]|uniref:Eukaryotic translation initiation factor 5a n=1 Tax=Fusarium austroafricanum TaxID=2364996 RepID=A0A8H4JSC9_9HYPO|nr:eukaryotic translation initiation factor 5a [Fusarium austroafricanum]
MSDDEFHAKFEQVLPTKTKVCSELQVGDHVLLKSSPCKIGELSNSGPDVHIVGIDIFTGEKIEDTARSTECMDIPEVHRGDYAMMNKGTRPTSS